MAGDFYPFLKNYLNSDDARPWLNASIEKIEVYQESASWRIYVATKDILTAEQIIATEKKLAEHLVFLSSLQIIMVNNDLDLIDKIILPDKQELVTSVFPAPGLFELLNWEWQDGKLDIITAERKVFNQVLQHDLCSKISQWLWDGYRLNILVRVVCTEEEQSNGNGNLIPRGEAEVLQSAIPGKPFKKRKSRVNKGLNNREPLKLKEIEEGLKSVVVEGEIWEKKFNQLRDGRFAVEYYLTDYTDTIIVKAFLDRKEDDHIHIGDWIRASGNVRYDEYVREIVLFMDTYLKKEKATRQDNCGRKRIELHAHTKMSAMDGLTDVSELIRMAAEWKHPAIAITDHGCTQAFPEAYAASRQYGVKVIYGVEGYLIENEKKGLSYHVVLLACNHMGLINLYRLVSLSYLDYFYRKPRIPRQHLQEYRQGLLVGTACQAGELYQAILQGADNEQLKKIADFYDYLEIQPLSNNEFLLKEGKVKSSDDLKEINQRIIKLGKMLGKPVVATGDVHFLEPHDRIYRTIIQAGQGYDDVESESALYYRTTEEMLGEFSYLGEAQAREVVVDNPQLLNEQIEYIKPVPDGFYPPIIEAAPEEISRLTWGKAHDLYGDQIPELVKTRIERELKSIMEHGFSVLYLIAHRLVKKSNQDGYLVGSRGSVGSSLVAFLTGITEVNPLEPHYLCLDCSYSEFHTDGKVGCGADLEEKTCPACGSQMLRDGFDIPFETFLGFEGDKVPDIDLNFSGEYQSKAHQYVEELFGKENVFRAGTISTIAAKTAYGFVKNYGEERQLNFKNSEINRLVKGITGVRRTTGQHPGGLIVVPKDRDIIEFTPLQYPADNKESGIITTHFDYHAIGDQLVKLDILGHDDPTVIKELEDLTGVRAASISLSEKNTMKIFSSVEPLGLKPQQINCSVGTFGIPEFGTRFVRQMLETTRPTTFSELVRISGLSHGTDVWVNNAQDLIKSGTARLGEVICTRDDIMTYLIYKGMDKKLAFKVMENVRKGRGLNPDQHNLMEECHIPSWYIESCQKIKYMFPKAHAVAYVTMAFRIAYFKVYHPREFYASFFSIRAEDFDAETILDGYETLKKRISEIDKQGNSASQKDKKLLTILEMALEMYARGYKFYPVDIYQSDARRFKVHKNGLLLSFSALPNVGLTAAQGIVLAREEQEFLSVEDFQRRSHLNKTAMEIMRKNNCFKGLPESSQLSLFN